MKKLKVETHDSSYWLPWAAVQIYHYYRLGSALLLAILYYGGFLHVSLSFYPALRLTMVLYIISALVSLFCVKVDQKNLKGFLIIEGCLDLIFITVLIYLTRHVDLNLGILMNVIVAAMGILMPGRMALFFAALASLLLLFEGLLEYWQGQYALQGFFLTGLHGIALLATAITVAVLSSRLRKSQVLAEQKSLALLDLERINDFIVHRLRSGIIVVDAHQRIRVINEAARCVLNMEYQDEGMELQDISPSLSNYYRCFREKENYSISGWSVLVPDLNMIALFLPLISAHQSATVISLDDVKRISDQTQQIKLASLGRLTASMAHELLNPLSAIRHAMECFSENENASQNNNKIFSIIEKHVDRMRDTMKNVLMISQRRQYHPSSLELKPWLKNFIVEYLSFDKNDISFKMLEHSIDAKVFFDKTQLYQILSNLCDNAVHYGKNSSGRTIITIAIERDVKTQYVVLDIRDEGSGIKEQDAEHIFEPFYTSSENSTGLGLYISKELCMANRANLLLMSSSSGAFFRLVFLSYTR